MTDEEAYYSSGGSGPYEPTSPDLVYQYYLKYISGGYDATNPNPTLSDTDKVNLGNISKTNFGDTLGKIADGILKYGNSFAELLIKTGVIKNPSLQLSADNVDIAKSKLALAALSNREKAVSEIVKEPPVTPPPTNSTFLGIDFSNGLNIALLLLALVGIWKLISSGSEQREQKEQNRGSQNFSPRPQRRSVNV